MKLRIPLLTVATILIAAHFLRAAETVPVLICLAAPFLLVIRKRGALRAIQSLTVVAAVIWLVTLNGIIQQRLTEGRPWKVAVVILGTVAGYTLLTGWLLNSPFVKGRYR
jgi:hypothetical protein